MFWSTMVGAPSAPCSWIQTWMSTVPSLNSTTWAPSRWQSMSWITWSRGRKGRLSLWAVWWASWELLWPPATVPASMLCRWVTVWKFIQLIKWTSTSAVAEGFVLWGKHKSHLKFHTVYATSSGIGSSLRLICSEMWNNSAPSVDTSAWLEFKGQLSWF